MELVGRVALVTGGGKRLGRAIAAGLAGRGMAVAIHHHASGSGAAELQREIQGAGGQAELFAADLRDAHAARALAGQVVARMGRLDVLINSAAVMVRATAAETTPELWDDIFALNLRAGFFCAQGAAAALKAARGKIINMADVGGMEPWAGYAAHSISKSAVIMLTRVLSVSLAPEVTVNAIAPGAVLIPAEWSAAAAGHLESTTPLKRLGSPDDIVSAVLYLLEGGDYVTGETLVVDGGRLQR
ncbi:MAG TPA: SDR family oxidoreductase [Gemmatimonadales bacterium]|nr:SDR family oxidoreductase [Gemmatimonadales bacterium]